MDFTIEKYKNFLRTLVNQGFSFYKIISFDNSLIEKSIILRHDVDKLPLNSLKLARIEAELGILGTYYFRMVPESFDKDIIKQIESLGHEIGYHYEDLTLAFSQFNLRKNSHNTKAESEEILAEKGIELFQKNLTMLRNIADVKTICMHGSPLSRWDNRLLWKYYDYRDFGIAREPYFDIDAAETLYLTDTGRRWDGSSVSIRDKITVTLKQNISRSEDPYRNWRVRPIPGSLLNSTPISNKFQNRYRFRSTSDIIRAAEQRRLPDKIMMTSHPQRWTDKLMPWMRELIWQKLKNVVKYYFVKI